MFLSQFAWLLVCLFVSEMAQKVIKKNLWNF